MMTKTFQSSGTVHLGQTTQVTQNEEGSIVCIIYISYLTEVVLCHVIVIN